MLNLLPEEEKKRLKREYTVRYLIVIFLAIIFTGIIYFVLAFPSYVISKLKQQELTAIIAELDRVDISKGVPVTELSLIDINKKIGDLRGTGKEVSIANIISEILNTVTSSIKINSFNYDKNFLMLNGMAKDRDGLTSFVKKLEENTLFTKVNLPVSNLAQEKNINFSIQISIKK